MSSHQGIVHLKISFIDNGEECVAFKIDVPDIKTAQRMDDGSKKLDDSAKKAHNNSTNNSNNTTTTTNTTTNTTTHHKHNNDTDVLNGSSGVRNNSDGIVINLDNCTALSGDIKVEIYTKQMMPRRKTLFSFWFNTFFESEREKDGELNALNQYSMNSQKLIFSSFPFKVDNNNPFIDFVLPKSEIDLAHKDVHCKIFPANFEVSISIGTLN